MSLPRHHLMPCWRSTKVATGFAHDMLKMSGRKQNPEEPNLVRHVPSRSVAAATSRSDRDPALREEARL